jgi:hypothetical protein
MSRRSPHVAREHEFEAQPGLPEPLPAGERLLWQGTPRWDVLARRVFHADLVALYFAALLAWRLVALTGDGVALGDALRDSLWLLPLFALGVGLLLLLAWLTARSTLYTLTDRRVVMRIGIVLTVAYNLPLRCIESADLHEAGHACGDIALRLEPETRIAWLHLWPHVRPWRVARTQPMLRALPDAQAVSALLAMAWSDANGTPAREVVTASRRPASRGSVLVAG